MTRLPDHGTYTRAVTHKCDCTPCRRYRLQRAYDRSNHVPRRTDATQPRSHLQQLLARNWSQDQIAAATGLTQPAISIILSGRYKGVRTTTAHAILSVRLDQAPPIPRGYVDATGTMRRLRALMTLGHTLPGIGRRARLSTHSLYDITHGRWDRVLASTAEAVARVYRDLSARPAPPSCWAEQARSIAASHGWHGPMAWGDIDDPHAEPQAVSSGRELKRDELALLRRHDIEHLSGFGLGSEEIAARLEMSVSTVDKILREQRRSAA